MKPGVMQQFLTNTDETGRFIVKSVRTGKTYAIEPIGDPHTKWGSVDPATQKLVNKPGFKKHRGSVDEQDSLITEANGFKNIVTLPPGTSPMAAIEAADAKYPSLA